MKKITFYTLISLVFVANAFAKAPQSITGTVEDALCGEMDPFIVGDACIVYTTDEKTGVKLGLVYPDSDWSIARVPEIDSETDTVGDRFFATSCKAITDAETIRALKDFGEDYFYLDCSDPINTFFWLNGEEESCYVEAEAAASTVMNLSENNGISLYSTKFLGRVELPDLLDGTESKFFESYYFIFSSDVETTGVAITTNEACTVVSKSILGSN